MNEATQKHMDALPNVYAIEQRAKWSAAKWEGFTDLESVPYHWFPREGNPYRIQWLCASAALQLVSVKARESMDKTRF